MMYADIIASSRKGLTGYTEEQLRELLQLPSDYIIGAAIDDGGCFFDSLAQALNAIRHEPIHSEKSLREHCHRLYRDPAYKSWIDQLNQQDYGGIEQGDNYYFVQYTTAELNRNFNGRPPIWGRPWIEGRLLCIAMNIERIHVIELMKDPSAGTLIAAHHLITSTGSAAYENIPYSANTPTLIVSQQVLHFVPILPLINRVVRSAVGESHQFKEMIVGTQRGRDHSQEVPSDIPNASRQVLPQNRVAQPPLGDAHHLEKMISRDRSDRDHSQAKHSNIPNASRQDSQRTPENPVVLTDDRQRLEINTSDFPMDYKEWFSRFKRVLHAYKSGLIQNNELEKFQLFLLSYGQFNANFTLEELKRLHYPLSPFALSDRHTYVRAADNWAMQVLRVIYQYDPFKKGLKKRLFPIFLGSNLFWQTLIKYCVVFPEADAVLKISNLLDQEDFISQGSSIWINLECKDYRKVISHKEIIEQKINSMMAEKILPQRSVPEILRPLFRAVLFNEKNNNVKFNKKEILAALGEFFPQTKINNINLANEINISLACPESLETGDSKWFELIAEKAKNHKTSLSSEVKTGGKLKQYAANSANRLNLISWLRSLAKIILEKPDPTIDEYITVIKDWIEKNFISVIYFFKQQYEEIEAIVFCDYSEAPEQAKSVIGNLGYRIDPVHAVRAILKHFPKLFIVARDTKLFWELFMQIDDLPKKTSEQYKALENLQYRVVSEIENPASPCEEDYSCITKLRVIGGVLKRLLEENRLSPALKIYGKHLFGYIDNYLRFNASENKILLITRLELEIAVEAFFDSCSSGNLSLAIRSVQKVSEIMSLDLENQPLSTLLPDFVRNKYLQAFSVQSVLIVPYAMRAFVQIFHIQLESEYKSRKPNIFVTNQSYFELLENLERLEKIGSSIELIKDVSEINAMADIIFVEIHPNNVVEYRQFSHDIDHLISNVEKWNNSQQTSKRRTLVVDITLNALDDVEIHQFLTKAKMLVDYGWLNIILIQSLTKFSQLGLDKSSAGLLIVVNNGASYWNGANIKLREMEEKREVDKSTMNLFSYHLGPGNSIHEYVTLINKNVRTVYENIMHQLNESEVWNRRRFQITMSSDPKSCYVALNMRGLLAEAGEGFLLNLADIVTFGKDVLRYLIYPLTNFFDLPLTERMSIGFPLSSINLVYDSIRFTIGLESDEQLKQYTNILAYTAFVINRPNEPRLFFDKRAGKYSVRQQYFKEKVEQFKALTYGSNCVYDFKFTLCGSNVVETMRLENGKINLWWDGKNERIIEYICIKLAKGEVCLPTNAPTPEEQQLRHLAISYLSTYKTDNKVCFSLDGKLIKFPSFAVELPWGMGRTYGPFKPTSWQTIYFHLYAKDIILCFNGYSYPESYIYIKRGSVVVPLCDMSIEDKGFFFSQGAWVQQASEFIKDYPRYVSQCYDTYIPIVLNNPLNFSIERSRIIIEQDFICYNDSGITIYKRFCGENKIYVEIDCWQEKDPVLSSFLSLMIAVVVQVENKKVSFLVRDYCFREFLFNIDFWKIDAISKETDVIFKEAARLVHSKRYALKSILTGYKRQEPAERYSFCTSALSWADGIAGVSEIKDKSLINSSLAVLGVPSYRMGVDMQSQMLNPATAIRQDDLTQYPSFTIKDGSWRNGEINRIPDSVIATGIFHGKVIVVNGIKYTVRKAGDRSVAPTSNNPYGKIYAAVPFYEGG